MGAGKIAARIYGDKTTAAGLQIGAIGFMPGMSFIGCLEGTVSSCKPETFYCLDDADTAAGGKATFFEFGTNMSSGILRSIVDATNTPATKYTFGTNALQGDASGCQSGVNVNPVNAPIRIDDVKEMCLQLGFDRASVVRQGTVITTDVTNCPPAEWNGASWEINAGGKDTNVAQAYRCYTSSNAPTAAPTSKAPTASPISPGSPTLAPFIPSAAPITPTANPVTPSPVTAPTTTAAPTAAPTSIICVDAANECPRGLLTGLFVPKYEMCKNTVLGAIGWCEYSFLTGIRQLLDWQCGPCP